ncbi:hypothetical protein C9374_011685 [Naegleria lovaniensis]|uniref:Uncharacterized protein n=1 Tax=Naegleria lovaniensis TaxID=51637 RepID=A0AA88G951_NAELO|nr:uncharacterized protein C9374_011685 [Naegleria lovaniensis]KAG2373800.1 hypothetical protein C9374_011685 [Naegleria lovaniensis]
MTRNTAQYYLMIKRIQILENLDESERYAVASDNQQELCPKMLNQLQKHVDCRRIHLQFSYPSFYHGMNGYAHDIVINKVKMHYWISSNTKTAIECVKMIVDVLVVDNGM